MRLRAPSMKAMVEGGTDGRKKVEEDRCREPPCGIG